MTSKYQCIVMLFMLAVPLCLGMHALKSTNEWDFFVFSQAWPPGTCVAGEEEHHTCHVPAVVTTWTIHGLWPSSSSGKGPEDCNKSWAFDFSKVAMITKNLTTFWPNLYNDTKEYSFWSHEWMKHGTCAADLPATSGQLNYFRKGLELNQMYNISRMLRQGGVVPSRDVQYSFENFTSAVRGCTGYSPVIECAAKKYKNGTVYHLIQQIEICLNKDFTPRECSNTRPHTGHQQTAPLDTGTALKFMNHNSVLKREKGVHYFQSDCPLHYNFNYPPIDHN